MQVSLTSSRRGLAATVLWMTNPPLPDHEPISGHSVFSTLKMRAPSLKLGALIFIHRLHSGSRSYMNSFRNRIHPLVVLWDLVHR